MDDVIIPLARESVTCDTGRSVDVLLVLPSFCRLVAGQFIPVPRTQDKHCTWASLIMSS